MKKTLDEILKRINAQLKLQEMTQVDLSIAMGKSPQWFTRLRYDQRDLKISDLIKACKILKVNIAEILPRETVLENYTITFEELVRKIVREEIKNK